MTAHTTIQRTLSEVRKQGLPHTLSRVTLKAINSVWPCKILKGVTISQVDEDFLKFPDGYTARFLSQNVIREFAKAPEYEMSEDFLKEAFAKGDECYALCDGETLAAYGWYSAKPTRTDMPDLFVQSSEDYVYMYKGFTHTRYRGQRLHAIGMTLALQSYRSRGFAGLVSYVEATNFDSLKSCARMGYTIFGTVYVGKIFGRYFQHRSTGCEKMGFRLAPAPARESEGSGRRLSS
jgi:hypothetical protein